LVIFYSICCGKIFHFKFSNIYDVTFVDIIVAAENSAISAIFLNTQKVSKLKNTNYPSRGYTMANFNNNL